MVMSSSTNAAELREQLGFPVIDTDGHCYEFMPAYYDYVRTIGGADMDRRLDRKSNLVTTRHVPQAGWRGGGLEELGRLRKNSTTGVNCLWRAGALLLHPGRDC